MMVETRSGLARMSSRSSMTAMTSLYSATILSCSRPGQALQAHLQNFLGLGFRQAVQAVLPCRILFQAFGAVVVGVDHAAAIARVRVSISRTSLAVPERVISSALATGGVGALRMMG